MRYYHLLLVDPPFAGRVTEWRWAGPEVKTIGFYVLTAITIAVVWRGRKRLELFDIAVLALTGDDLVGLAPEISGPASLSQIDQMRDIGSALGRELRWEELPRAEALTARWDEEKRAAA